MKFFQILNIFIFFIGNHIATFVDEKMQNAFSKLYKNGGWDQGKGGGSGKGSTLKGTSEIRPHIVEMIQLLNVTTVLDAPCGGMVWMPHVLEELENKSHVVYYTGADIVPEVVERVKNEFSNHTNWQFKVHDIAHQKISTMYDLIIARDVFFHLTFDNIKCALNHFSQSGSKYLLTTSNPGAENVDKATTHKEGLNEGGWRATDLQAPPISLPPPFAVLHERQWKRIVGWWKLPLAKFENNSFGGPLVC